MISTNLITYVLRISTRSKFRCSAFLAVVLEIASTIPFLFLVYSSNKFENVALFNYIMLAILCSIVLLIIWFAFVLLTEEEKKYDPFNKILWSSSFFSVLYGVYLLFTKA